MALPEKDWYTLDEIAQRWGCSVDDLWHYAEAEPPLLRLSIRLNRPLRIEWVDTISPDFDDPDRKKPFFVPASRGPFGLDADELRLVLGGKKAFDTFLPPDLDDDHSSFYGTEVIVEWGEQHFSHADVEVQGPIIARAERDRFEKLHRIGAHAGAMPTDKDMLDARERASLLRMLAVLIADATLPNQPHKAAGIMEAMAARHSIALPAAKTLAEKITLARKAASE